ncbi:MAG: response regulator [Desulfobacteraceae bacterium]|nr:response regulator [Desulfobacteraceae bacterium]
MGINYKILWVDDRMETFNELEMPKDIINYLNELGFSGEIQCLENIDDAEKLSKDIKFDLILSDYNIGDGYSKNGDTLIKKIRDGAVFTEVLFYSAQTDIEEIAKKLFQDRVSFYTILPEDRGYQGFLKKIKHLIEQTIQKLQEIESVRGLVMSETSRLDAIVMEILEAYFESGNEKCEILKQDIIKNIGKSFGKNYIKDDGCNLKNCRLKISELTGSEITKERIFDADKKAMALEKMLKLEKHNPIVFKHTTYLLEVIKVRNDLAHAKALTKDGKEFLVLAEKDGEKEFRFDQSRAVGIRKDLLKYDKILSQLKDQYVIPKKI